MSKSKIAFYALAGCLALASCQSNKVLNQGGTTTPNLRPANDLAALNGKWVPTNEKERKVYYNEFRDGKFVGRSPDGKSTFAVGTYKYAPNGDILMNWYSEARKAHANAICKIISEQVMQCTSGASVFNLQRA